MNMYEGMCTVRTLKGHKTIEFIDKYNPWPFVLFSHLSDEILVAARRK